VSPLGRYFLRRTGQLFVVLVLIACINFLVLHLAPGDLVDVLAGEAGSADAGYMHNLRVSFGLDQPLYIQLGRYLWNLLHLNLGFSFRYNMSVIDLILSRLPATILLMSTSIVLALSGGIVLGIAAARKPGSLQDTLISMFALVGYATPLFWLGLVLIVIFSVKLGLLPSDGMRTIGGPDDLSFLVWDIARHLLLPALTLALFYMATYARLMRASMLETYGMDFVRTARAKGISQRQVAYRHVFSNAVLPLVSLVGVQLGAVLGGSVVVEVVFGWPGLGTLAFEAIFQRDINLLMGILFLCSVMVVIANFAVDLLYTWLDPRIDVTI
jgi:peptide/nickel transport system permease protein